MFYTRAHVRSLESQITDLKARLDTSEAERSKLLDRLLAKNNIEPVQSQPIAPSSPALRVLSPSTASTPEERTAYEQSWLEEERDWLKLQFGYDDDRAATQAQQNYLQHHKLIS